MYKIYNSFSIHFYNFAKKTLKLVKNIFFSLISWFINLISVSKIENPLKFKHLIVFNFPSQHLVDPPKKNLYF